MALQLSDNNCLAVFGTDFPNLKSLTNKANFYIINRRNRNYPKSYLR